MAYDLAGDLFDHLLKNLENNSVTTVNAATTSWETVGSLRRFNQQQFVDDGLFGYAGLGEWGYMYYPDTCKSKSCKVHMHFHGCSITHQGFTKDIFKDHGFLHYAATNDIIVLFPQAEFTFNFFEQTNVMPCFASGYVWPENEENYLTNQSIQAKALKGMLDRVVESKNTDLYDYDAGNINNYNLIENFFERSWIGLTNLPDLIVRSTLFIIFYGIIPLTN